MQTGKIAQDGGHGSNEDFHVSVASMLLDGLSCAAVTKAGG